MTDRTTHATGVRLARTHTHATAFLTPSECMATGCSKQQWSMAVRHWWVRHSVHWILKAVAYSGSVAPAGADIRQLPPSMKPSASWVFSGPLSHQPCRAEGL